MFKKNILKTLFDAEDPNHKASPNKYKNKAVEGFRSTLEATAASLLAKAEIPFTYETWEVTLLEPFVYDIDSYERIGTKFKLQSKKVRGIKYTPDFIGKNWIIETKGKKTPDFQIKWKLFKDYLRKHSLEYALFMPTNKREIIQSIEIIKQL